MGRRVCAWCGKDMGPAATEQDTHGICTECMADVLGKRDAKPCQVTETGDK